jgi:Xaa-Pro aminopeptidase
MTSALPLAAGRIADLRAALARHGFDAVLVPSSDPHLSEYLPDHWQGRRWASGFTGSVGNLVVTADFAGLFADSRYWIQAERELAGSGIALMKTPAAASALHVQWLAENVREGGTVAVDGTVLALSAQRALLAAFQARRLELKLDVDLIGEVWRDRTPRPQGTIFEHAMPHAVMPRAAKLAAVREAMRRAGADWHFLSTLDDIAWLTNLRGRDVAFNPVFLAFALIGMQHATLFVADGAVDAELRSRLAADGFALAPYEQAGAALGALPQNAAVLADPDRNTVGTLRNAGAKARWIEAINPSTLLKSRKSEAEAAFVRATMEQDGAALCEFFAWLDDAIGRGAALTELDIDREITAARARRPGYFGQSFATIAGFNANGALPHYRATAESHASIEGDGLLLIDSGGQYAGGTTDITRMVAIGKVSAAQKRDCTLVLKGMIALARARFPRGTKGPMLDAIARAPIWAAAINYGHGTGHGVGYFMNVHEGPQTISPAAQLSPHHALEPGMITSDEPGIYRPGQWGVRIENLLLAVPYETNEFGEFLAFETLTLCPIDTRCLEPSLLDDAERRWLDEYHAAVRARLAPHLAGAPLDWLMRATQPLA